MTDSTSPAVPRRRRHGGDAIEPMSDGRWSIRRAYLEPCATYEAAEALLADALAEIAERSRVPVEGETLRLWGASWLDEREIGGMEDTGSDRSRWRMHLATALFIDWPMKAIRPVHVREWLAAMLKEAAPGHGHKTARKRKIGKQTGKNHAEPAPVPLAAPPCRAARRGEGAQALGGVPQGCRSRAGESPRSAPRALPRPEAHLRQLARAGWRGRRWTQQEVAGLLGHRSVSTTERYAHLAESALHDAARETEAAGRSPYDRPTVSGLGRNHLGFRAPRQELNLRPSVQFTPSTLRRRISKVDGT